MDPLSIGSAVVGLIAAATRIGPLLHHFITHTRDAPKSASQIMDEMNSITAALERLQIYLMGALTTNVARRSLLSLHNIVATLTACVTTYSDLERVVDKCVNDGKIRRIKWMMNESDIEGLLQRVQAHKLSLTFMLTILQCVSMQEAEDSMNRLVDLVDELVASNADLKIRIDALAMDHSSSLAPTSRMLTADTASTSSSFPSQEFEEDLNNSRVYRRLRPRDSLYSINSAQRASMALSAFSDLTLGNISVISVLCIPIWSTDLSNSSHYRFGREGLALTIDELSGKYPDINFPDLDQEDLDMDERSDQLSQNHDESGERKQSENLDDPEVLFYGASLFQFNIDRNRREGGLPYLVYVPGEIFDVIGVKGELWLARNQDDPQKVIGWIWQAHFARILLGDDEENDRFSKVLKESKSLGPVDAIVARESRKLASNLPRGYDSSLITKRFDNWIVPKEYGH